MSSIPVKFHSKLCPKHAEEEKENFFQLGKLPFFLVKAPKCKRVLSSEWQISTTLLSEALHILEKVLLEFGDADTYYDFAFGNSISCKIASDLLVDYMKDHQIFGHIKVYWVSELLSWLVITID